MRNAGLDIQNGGLFMSAKNHKIQKKYISKNQKGGEKLEYENM